MHLHGVGVIDLVWGHYACSVLEWEKGHKGLGIMRDEALNWLAATAVGMGIPSPPSRTGSANTFLSASLKAGLPVMAGNRCSLMASSRGCSMSLMSGTTCIRKVHLPTRPFVSAQYAVWGCDSAIIERCLISLTHFSTLAEMNNLQNSSVPRGAPRCFFP